MTQELATAEVEKWLEQKKIKPRRRTASQASIDNIIEAVQYGDAVINADNTIDVKLSFPICDSNNTPVHASLHFKSRVQVDALLKAYDKEKANSIDAQLLVIIAELTDLPFTIITKMEPVDLTLAKSIGVFFMS